MFSNGIPDLVDTVSIVQALEDSIAANHNEVKIVLNFEGLDVGVAHDHVWVTAVLRALGLDVSEGFAYRKTPREDPKWSLDIHVLLAWVSSCFCKSLGPINFSSCSLDPDFLELVVWLVVTTENSDLAPRIDAHHGTRIPNIDDVDHIVNDHYDVGTRARPLRTYILPIHHVLGSCLSLFHQRQEILLALSKAFPDCFDWILRKLLILNHEVVQVVS